MPFFGHQSDINGRRSERPIAPKATKSDWFSIAAILSPLLLFAVLFCAPRTRAATTEFVHKNWGNIASVWGLGVGIYFLFVAKGARTAAQEAKSEERLRTALEELEDASEKCRHIGQLVHDQKWELVRLRAQEVMGSCRAIAARWGNDPSVKDHRNQVIQVATFMRSVVEETHNDTVNGKNILRAQLNSDEKLTTVAGKIHREQESGRL
jgi:nitrogen regulatory protein PII-like uncharacterized protein